VRDASFPKASLTCLNIAFRVPIKGALPPSSPHRASIERDIPIPEPSICLSKSLVKRALLQVPHWGTLWREMSVSRAFFYISLRFPNKQALLIKQNLTFLSKSPVKEPPLYGLLTGPCGERCLFLELMV